MNILEVARYEKMLAEFNPYKLNQFITELKLRASGLHTRKYNKLEELRLATGAELPEIGLMGTESPYSLAIDIDSGYSFQTEYAIMNQELSAMGYTEKIKTSESVDPSALSNLMTMAFEKRKALEDRTMQLLGSINQVIKSVISITYELKELDRNLVFYDLLKSSEPEKKAAADLALKRIFVDNVDARKGPASLASLSRGYQQGQGGAGFIDLIAIFYSLKSLRDAEALQRNEQYKNIIKNRYIEYEEWKKINGDDLRNRREMLLQYLRSQFASYKMYADWAAQSLTILKRINLKGVKNAEGYMNSTKKPDIMEMSQFNVELMVAKPVYRKAYDVEYQKVFGKRGIALPSSASLKSASGALLTRGPRESSRAFIHQEVRRYGPEVIAAQEVSFSFMEKQTFPKGMPQDRAQYIGTLGLKIKPYCFTLDEWFLFKKATEALINKTVFEGVDQVAVSSLTVIKKDLDKYIKEAEKRDKPEAPKRQSNYALLDIYQSFKDDLFGINKALSFTGSGGGKRDEFDRELYQVELHHRLFQRSRMKDAIAVGLLIAGSEGDHIYEEFKRRKGLLHQVDVTHNPLF